MMVHAQLTPRLPNMAETNNGNLARQCCPGVQIDDVPYPYLRMQDLPDAKE